jgi:hypothetical protein
MRRAATSALVLAMALGAVSARIEAGEAAAAPAVPPTFTLAHAVAATLETVAVKQATTSPSLTATGRVLDPSPFVETFVARRTARRSAAIAARELRRVSALHREGDNASEREVEAARIADDRAGADRTSAEARFVGVWGTGLTQRGDLAALVEPLAQHARALGRLELPAGTALPAPPRLLSLSAPTLGRFELSAEILGAASSTDSTLQGPALLVLLGPGAPPPGTALLAELGPERTARGVQVPESALVWHEGHALVFIAHGHDTFESRPVVLGGALPGGWQVRQGLEVGERVVTRGAQQLLSARTLPARADD